MRKTAENGQKRSSNSKSDHTESDMRSDRKETVQEAVISKMPRAFQAFSKILNKAKIEEEP